MVTLTNRLSHLADGFLSCEHWFAHSPISSKGRYRAYFRAPVRFDMPVTGLRLRAGDLDRTISRGSDAVRKMAEFYIESRYAPVTEAFRERCERLGMRLLMEGQFTLEAVASAMAMNRRTLQRRLNEENTSFRDIREAAQRRLAHHYLTDTRMPLKEIAHRLGYAEGSALARSCQRWFSATPREIRNSADSQVL
jgi:AraC-like DNA-binding protein